MGAVRKTQKMGAAPKTAGNGNAAISGQNGSGRRVDRHRQPFADAGRTFGGSGGGEEDIAKAETMQGGCSGWIYLSYHSVGKTNGLLPAVRLTEVTIQAEEGARQVPEAWIAVGTGRVGSTMHCQIILPPDW